MTTTTARPAVTLSVALAPYVGHRLRHRLEVRSGDGSPVVAGWYDSRREAMRAGLAWAKDRGYRVIREG